MYAVVSTICEWQFVRLFGDEEKAYEWIFEQLEKKYGEGFTCILEANGNLTSEEVLSEFEMTLDSIDWLYVTKVEMDPSTKQPEK